MTNLGKKEDLIEIEGYGLKRRDLRQWWYNVVEESDEEILVIDKLEDNLEFQTDYDKKIAYNIRKAIGKLEGCHFKVQYYINRIIYAIKNNQFPQSSMIESAQLNKDWVRDWETILSYLEKWSSLKLDTSSNKQEFINGVKKENIIG